MALRPLLPAFASDEEAAAFRDEEFRSSLPQVRAMLMVAVTLLSVLLVLNQMARFQVDPWLRRLAFWYISVCELPATLLLLALAYTRWFRWVSQVGLGLVVFAVLGGSVVIEYTSSAAQVSAALLGVALAPVYLLLRLRLAVSSLVCGLVSAAYVVAMVLQQMPALTLATDVIALVAANVFGVSGAIALERHSRASFLQRRVIERQGRELAEANEKSERLLANLLPSSIASRLKEASQPIADRFGAVTVLFADLMGFTELSERLEPEAVVAMLNEVFSAFDALADRHGVEKIKTIGDAYMVAGGLPVARADHAEAVVKMGLDMLQALERINAARSLTLRVRIGINSGPVVAGVIGTRKLVYDLWGDAVNVASRMESHGLPGQIHVTEATHALLCERYHFEARGSLEIKGKGAMSTYLLRERRA